MEQQTIMLRLARYRFHWKVTSTLQLPPYAGSTLRGVFGWALRTSSCLTGRDVCSGCPVVKTCSYPSLFEPQLVSQHLGSNVKIPVLASYAIEADLLQEQQYRSGEMCSFDMVLMTPASLSKLNIIIAAWRRAFAKGVGKNNGTAVLIKVEHIGPDMSPITIYDSNGQGVLAHKTDIALPQYSQAQDVHLYLRTPLRIEQKSRLVRDKDLTASLFLRHLIRRVSFHIANQTSFPLSIETIHQLNTQADQVRDGFRHLMWHDWSRYSMRQNKKMILGGVLGSWTLLEVPPDLLPFVYLGQWMHVGKEAVFGLGRYEWHGC